MTINPPSAEIRSSVVDAAREARSISDGITVTPPAVEEGVEKALDMVLREMNEARFAVDPQEEMTFDAAEEDLASVHAWASLASRVVGEVYAPASPFPWNTGGWGSEVAKRLQKIAAKLAPVALPAAHRIGANGVSIGISFPWGVSVSISY